ncbi:hypothetical protein HDU82_002825 [Entophlyctis luteolus]|nr:hypothetical protein HDU82_002825 [Entophlyctis luteolus]
MHVNIKSLYMSFAVIVVSEIGDKTFLIAAVMAMTNPRLVIFSAALAALGVMTVLSTLFGHFLPNLLSKEYTQFAASILFIVFGFKMLYDGYNMSDSEGQAELEEVTQTLMESSAAEEDDASIMEAGKEKAKRKEKDTAVVGTLAWFTAGWKNIANLFFSTVFIQCFALTFLAEWGDRSQIARVSLIAAGWTAFIAENLILSEYREELVARFGLDSYRRAYGALSTAACASIAYGYLAYGYRKGPKVIPLTASSPIAGRAVVFALQALGFAGLLQSLPKLQIPVTYKADAAQPAISNSSDPKGAVAGIPKLTLQCPIDFAGAKASAQVGQGEREGPTGLHRISRHPQLFSLAFVCLGSAFATPYLTTRVLCGFPAIVAVVGGAHQDSRFARGGKWSAEFFEATSLIPFVAIAQGKQQVGAVWEELKHTNAGLGMLVAAGLMLGRNIGRPIHGAR